MDIRVFLAVITVSMAVSFTIGVAMGPSPPDYAAVQHAAAHQVKSVEMNSMKKLPHEAASDDVHEPAGQVSLRPPFLLMGICVVPSR